VRVGMVEVTGSTVTILAERVAAVEEVTPEFLNEEILQLTMTRDASGHHVTRAQTDTAIARLEEFKANLKLWGRGAALTGAMGLEGFVRAARLGGSMLRIRNRSDPRAKVSPSMSQARFRGPSL
jgi:hypothetical protein